MVPDNCNDDLKNVSEEAGAFLKKLDGAQSHAMPGSLSAKSESNQNSNVIADSPSKTVSKEMLVRLEAIDKLVSQGYQIKKTWDAIPGLVSSSGVKKSILGSSPAGFSWIAFLFPFAVCAQIKEWSYFYVVGSLYLAGSVFYKVSGWDPAFVIGLALGVQYAYYYPYLRWLAVKGSRAELGKGASIVLGLLYSFLCIIPSLVFEAIFIG